VYLLAEKRKLVNHNDIPNVLTQGDQLQLTNQTLAIAVWHNGRLSRNAFLGEVMITLDVRDLDSPQEECVVLMAKVCYHHPKKQMVHVLFLFFPKGQNVPAAFERLCLQLTFRHGYATKGFYLSFLSSNSTLPYFGRCLSPSRPILNPVNIDGDK
jgi:hypothetical protein